MLHGLYDEDTLIVERTLASLATLCELGLYQAQDTKQMAKEAAALVCDPTHTTRLSAVALFAAIGGSLDAVDCWCFVYPHLAPFLETEIGDLSDTSILEALKPPLSFATYQSAMGHFKEKLLANEDIDLANMALELANPLWKRL